MYIIKHSKLEPVNPDRNGCVPAAYRCIDCSRDNYDVDLYTTSVKFNKGELYCEKHVTPGMRRAMR